VSGSNDTPWMDSGVTDSTTEKRISGKPKIMEEI
jgi:hypothetical protein